MLDLYKAKKKVLITGGSRGIGAQAVREFTGIGAEVCFFYKNSDEAAFRLSKETGALNIRCDVSKPESVSSAMNVAYEFFGGEIDVLILNAGISDFNLITDIGVEGWNRIIDTDLNSAFYCINQVLPQMISSKSGNIILVSSMWGQVGASCEVAYSTAKAGLIGLTKALAKEVGPSGIRVNCVAPGMIDTDMNGNVSDDIKREIIEDTPVMRMGTAEDVARTMVFLASERSSFITGQVIGVNGGLVI